MSFRSTVTIFMFLFSVLLIERCLIQPGIFFVVTWDDHESKSDLEKTKELETKHNY